MSRSKTKTKTKSGPSHIKPSYSELARLLETECDEALWTFDQVAGLLQFPSPRTVQRSLVDPGLLKTVQLSPKKQRIRVRDLREYLNRENKPDIEKSAVRLLRTSHARTRAKKRSK